jgi:death-on-curing protein
VTTEYLTIDDMVAIHQWTMYASAEAFQGIRDHGGLESAMMRPQFLAHYRAADLCEQAAALGLGISRSQAFVEGNKRTGQMAIIFLLDLDGYRLAADPLDLARRILTAAQPDRDHEQRDRALAGWLRANIATTE